VEASAGVRILGVVLDLFESAIYLADNAAVLPQLPSGAFQLVYLDPPFNTGRTQQRATISTTRDPNGDRVGFGGQRYRTEVRGRSAFGDSFDDYLGFLEPRLREVRRLLAQSGTLYLHLDYREAHYCKVLLDEIFGRECFLNEIIWAYDYGARTRRRWPAKHDTILVYVRDPERYLFDAEAVDREPYMAPGLVTPEKAVRGKLPTDVWWHTIVSPTGREKTGYPTQKPIGVLRRIVNASSRPGDWCLDCFAGSGTLGAAAAELGRRYVLVDSSPEAARVMRERLGAAVLDREGRPVCDALLPGMSDRKGGTMLNENYSLEQVAPYVGLELRDGNGNSAGYVDVIFVDDDTGQPEWFGFWNGLPGGKRRIVPIRGAVRDGPDVAVPWTKEVMEQAPSYDDEDDRGILRDDPDGIHLSRAKEDEAYRLYGIEPLTPPPAREYVARFRAVVVTAAR
jgi:site-specific DNA-methyltransferase (adenine-specific)